MQINRQRLKRNLIELGTIGYQGELSAGLPYGGQGINRPAFTAEYEKANQYVKELMEEVGLETYRDSVGNLFGRSRGQVAEKSIIIGSHIDTVPSGGMFDGVLGVLSALECIQRLVETDYYNQHTLEVAVFIGEEGNQVGGTFGSRCFSGNFELNEKNINSLSQVGIKPQEVKEAIRNPATIKNYIELHVEQGAMLDNKELSIGVVKGIIGIARYKVVVKGRANHAGTTPMDLRDDALVKASHLITKVNEIINQMGDNLVGTVGDIDVEPGAVNVIPGRVEFPIELRHTDKDIIKEVINKLQNEARDLNITIKRTVYKEGVHLDQAVQNVIQQVCNRLNYEYDLMFSGAGHDVNPLSSVAPSGMIFVPSQDGISHSSEEWTAWQDVEKGANTLLHTIKELDKK
ncbi:allantoate amidohydrolase [Halanaerobaculum tunisiense]